MTRDWLSLLLHAQFSAHCDGCGDSKYSGLSLPSSSSQKLWDQEGICFLKGSEKCSSVRILSLKQIHLWQHHKAFQTQGVPKVLSRVTQKWFCLNQNENEKRSRIQSLDMVQIPSDLVSTALDGQSQTGSLSVNLGVWGQFNLTLAVHTWAHSHDQRARLLTSVNVTERSTEDFFVSSQQSLTPQKILWVFLSLIMEKLWKCSQHIKTF